MSRIRSLASMATALSTTVVVVLALAGCASPGEAVADEPVPTQSTPASTPTPTPSEPQPVVVDPADVTTWTITAAGIGPLGRGDAYPEVLAGLPAFAVAEWCPWVAELTAEGAASLLLTHPEGGEEITSVWLSGRADEAGVVPASPTTEAGIVLGSTLEELSAAYPDLQAVNQTGENSYGYAVGDEENGYLDFLVENGVVVMIGVQDRAGVPKEFCG
ncbi:hypothetical protein ESP57_08100 [Agromyces fucosus]|uniref:Uncharacterized protein n=1 Tax=Agromyces fucosus TaxID=41985 RepID=A0A4Q2JLW2_9MICO|nr:hypothetical protein [Agromyces fucosus]RXZ48922.1 hypothetical protein ESP57_08100 [Agromyces fucosus]